MMDMHETPAKLTPPSPGFSGSARPRRRALIASAAMFMTPLISGANLLSPSSAQAAKNGPQKEIRLVFPKNAENDPLTFTGRNGRKVVFTKITPYYYFGVVKAYAKGNMYYKLCKSDKGVEFEASVNKSNAYKVPFVFFSKKGPVPSFYIKNNTVQKFGFKKIFACKSKNENNIFSNITIGDVLIKHKCKSEKFYFDLRTIDKGAGNAIVPVIITCNKVAENQRSCSINDREIINILSKANVKGSWIWPRLKDLSKCKLSVVRNKENTAGGERHQMQQTPSIRGSVATPVHRSAAAKREKKTGNVELQFVDRSGHKDPLYQEDYKYAALLKGKCDSNANRIKARKATLSKLAKIPLPADVKPAAKNADICLVLSKKTRQSRRDCINWAYAKGDTVVQVPFSVYPKKCQEPAFRFKVVLNGKTQKASDILELLRFAMPTDFENLKNLEPENNEVISLSSEDKFKVRNALETLYKYNKNDNKCFGKDIVDGVCVFKASGGNFMKVSDIKIKTRYESTNEPADCQADEVYLLNKFKDYYKRHDYNKSKSEFGNEVIYNFTPKYNKNKYVMIGRVRLYIRNSDSCAIRNEGQEGGVILKKEQLLGKEPVYVVNPAKKLFIFHATNWSIPDFTAMEKVKTFHSVMRKALAKLCKEIQKESGRCRLGGVYLWNNSDKWINVTSITDSKFKDEIEEKTQNGTQENEATPPKFAEIGRGSGKNNIREGDVVVFVDSTNKNKGNKCEIDYQGDVKAISLRAELKSPNYKYNNENGNISNAARKAFVESFYNNRYAECLDNTSRADIIIVKPIENKRGYAKLKKFLRAKLKQYMSSAAPAEQAGIAATEAQ